jgi:hexosaminidase
MWSVDQLVPVPVSAVPSGSPFPLAQATGVRAAGEAAVPSARELATELSALTGREVPVSADGTVELRVEPVEGGPEAYRLEVWAEGIRLTAGTTVGLHRGTQTLLQLRRGDAIAGGRIDDAPRYPYRGLMLDVARHFLPVAEVCRVIDLAALFKLNHLHLHLTDDQGWRIAIDSWPRLATYGGGTEVGGGPGGYYTKDDYRAIVAHAGRRHITLVPEIDLPGHTNAALASYPELTPGGTAPDRYTGIEVGFSALAVESELTYRFLDDVFAELAALTPGEFLHIGGDEAKTLDAERYALIVNRAQEIVVAHGKTAIGWHEIAAAKLAPGSVIQYWGVTGSAPEVLTAAAQGSRVILSPARHAYLDMRYDEGSRIGLSWAGHISVADAYGWDPDRLLPGLDPAAVFGVEAPLWTETVRSRADLDYLLLPRLAATAEIAWSPAAGRDWADFRRRLGAQAPRWDALGVAFHRAPEVDWR